MERKLETKQTKKSHVEIKGVTLSSLALSESRLSYVIHMFSMKIVKQTKRNKSTSRWRNPILERLPVCLLAVESYWSEKIGIPLSEPHWPSVLKRDTYPGRKGPEGETGKCS